MRCAALVRWFIRAALPHAEIGRQAFVVEMGVRWESGLEARSGYVWSCGRICSTGRNQLMPVSGVVPDVENARQACDLYSAQQIRKPHRACARSGSRACLLHGEAAF